MSRKKENKRIEDALLGLYRIENEKLTKALAEKDAVAGILKSKIKEQEEYINELSDGIRNNITICTNCGNCVSHCSEL